jgi:DNA-binding MarR family transcriptional regulator
MSLDDERLTAVGLFFEAHAGLATILERRLAADCGLPSPWFEVLVRLARSPGAQLRMADLAAQVALSPSGLTRAVDRLEEAGLVARAECPSDRRGAFAVLTAEGRARLEAGLPGQLAEVEQHFSGVLSPGELDRLAATLRKLRDHLNPTAGQVTDEAG